MRRHLLLGASAALLAVTACRDTATPTDPATPTPSLAQGATQDSRIVVVFNDDVPDPPGLARALAAQYGGSLRFTYTTALKGFAGAFPAAALDGLQRHAAVAYVEPDAEVRLFDTQTNPPSWGLDRVDQRDLPFSNSYTYANTGTGANVYILDTGIRRTHNDFGGRVQYVPNGSNGDFVGDGHGSAEDCHGHGTHVAGTAAGSSFGVAKGAPIWAARVVNCSGGGQVSMAIAAVDWVTANGIRPASVNMSLGYGNVQSLRDAVENSIAAGVNYAVAAGNGNFVGIPQDACGESPAGAPNANTVGATQSNDAEAPFSNYGPCVDLLAPGMSITSAWHSSNTATNTISGTSMATPHVAGAIALYLTANPSATPGQVSQALKDNASLNKITLHRRSAQNGTANRLLYTAFIGGGGPPGNQPPDASFTYLCTELTCSFTDASSDPDGSIVSRSWTFGDGGSSNAQNPSHIYASSGTYPVTLTVTDNQGATDVASQNVTVSSSSGGNITLTVSTRSNKKWNFAELSWTGASGSNVDIYKDGAPLVTTTNDGSHTDQFPSGSGSFTYQVCNAGTTTCSNEVTVPF